MLGPSIAGPKILIDQATRVACLIVTAFAPTVEAKELATSLLPMGQRLR